MSEEVLLKVINKFYNKHNESIKECNISYEREKLGDMFSDIFLKRLFQGFSFEDYFFILKKELENGKYTNINEIYNLLKDYFLFSEDDFIYRKKLKVDAYCTANFEQLVYPMIKKDIFERFENKSFEESNPNYDENLFEIYKLISNYFDLSCLLNYLYCNDFCFKEGWDGLISTGDFVLDILEKSRITSNDYLISLIDYKCEIFTEIMNEIKNNELKEEMLERIINLKSLEVNKIKNKRYGNVPIINLVK